MRLSSCVTLSLKGIDHPFTNKLNAIHAPLLFSFGKHSTRTTIMHQLHYLPKNHTLPLVDLIFTTYKHKHEPLAFSFARIPTRTIHTYS